MTVSVLEEGRVASLHFMIHKVSCKEGRQEAAFLPEKERRRKVSLKRPRAERGQDEAPG